MVVRLCVERAALAAPDNHAMRVMMGHIHKQRRLATAATIRLVTAAFARRCSGRVLDDVRTCGLFRRDQDHVELRHVHLSFGLSEAQRPALSTFDFSLPAKPTLMYRCAP